MPNGTPIIKNILPNGLETRLKNQLKTNQFPFKLLSILIHRKQALYFIDKIGRLYVK